MRARVGLGVWVGRGRHGPLASQTHMLVTASYFLASAIIVIVAYFCWHIPHWARARARTRARAIAACAGQSFRGRSIWVYSANGLCVVILKAENTSGYCPGTASEGPIK